MADTINKNIEVTVVNKASAALKNISKDFGDVADSAENVNKKSGNLASGISGIITKLGPLAAGAAGAYVSFNKMKELFASSISEFKEGELAQTQLSTALGYTTTSLIDYADSLQKVTMYSDDELIAAQAQFAMYTKDEQQINKLTKAATDLAAAKGIDLNTATNLLTRSIGTGTNVLARYGVQMKDTADITERINSITESTTSKFNNMAEALGKTRTGKLTILTNEVNNLKEALGQELITFQEDWNQLMLQSSKEIIPALTLAVKGLHEQMRLANGATGEQLQFETDVNEVYKKSPVGIKLLTNEIERLTKERNKLLQTKGPFKYIDAEKAKEKLVMIEYAQQALSDLEDKAAKKSEAIQNASLNSFIDQIRIKVTQKQKEHDEIAAYELKQQEALDAQVVSNLRKHEEEKTTIRKKNTEEVNRWEKEQETKKGNEKSLNEEKITSLKDFIQRKKEIEQQHIDETLNQQFKIIDTSINDQLTRNKFLLDQKIISQEEYNAYAIELERSKLQQEFELNIQFASKMTDITSTVVSMASSLQSTYFEGVNHEADKKAKKEREHAMATIKNRKQLDAELKRIDGEAEKRAEEQYKAQKKMAMIMSIVQTAQAVTGALTMMPPPVGIAMAIIVGALGAIQTGIIASQAFAGGGIVQSAGAPSTGDKVNARLNPGEMVLNQTQKDNMLWNLATTRQRQEQPMSVGGDTYVVQGNLDTNAVKEIKKYKEEFLDVLRSSNKELAQRGYQYAY